MPSRSPELVVEHTSSGPCPQGGARNKRSVEAPVLHRKSDHIEKLARLGTFEVDLETEGLRWSSGIYRVFGLNLETPVSIEESLRFFDLHARRQLEACLESARILGQPYDITVPFRQQNGEARWMRVMAHVSRASGRSKLVGAVQDITRELDAGSALRVGAHDRCAAEADQMLLEEVKAGLARGEFKAHYQPIIDLKTQIVRGWEALIRWHHPNRGFLSPSQFSAALVHPDISPAIDDFMLSTSLRQMRRWLDAGVPVTCAGVNVSEVQLKRPDFAARVLAQLNDQGLTPDRLEIEVLETAFLGQDTDAVASTIDQLARRGVVSALDDFGTGYASLTHLKQFRVERIKIDRSFVANLDRNDFDRTIVRCLTSLGRDLGIRITAEGIETVEQLRILRSMGCDCGQGYLFSPPLPARDVPAFLGEWNSGAAARVLGAAPAAVDQRQNASFAEWAIWDAAVLVGCFGRDAKSIVERFARAEQAGALTDVFPEQHFERMLESVDGVMAGCTE